MLFVALSLSICLFIAYVLFATRIVVQRTSEMSEVTDKNMDALRVRINSRIKILDALRDDQILTPESYEEMKKHAICEEIDRMHKEKQEVEKASAQFLPEEVAREPFLKEMLRQDDFWKRHKAAVQKDLEGWEKGVRDTFIAKCKSNLMSPILLMVCDLLIMSEDKEEGRRKVLEIFLMQDSEERVKMFNWLQLKKGPQGSELTHGKKVDSLSYPLFSFLDPDTAQRNSQILTELASKQCRGGNAENPSLRGMYMDEQKVLMGGAMPFPVVDSNGVESGYYVDMEPVHNAFIGLQKSVESHDGQESLHLSFIQKLLEKFSHSPSTRPQKFDPTTGRGELWKSSNASKTRKPFFNGRFRGGEAPSEPKNEFSPS